MNVLFLAISFFYSLNFALAKTQIKLNNGQTLKDCHTESHRISICENGAYFVSIAHPFFAVSTQNEGLQTFRPVSVTVDGRAILQTAPGFGDNTGNGRSTLVHERLDQLSRLTFDLEFMMNSSAPFSEQARNKAEEILAITATEKQKALNVLNGETFEWQNESGQSRSCSRIKFAEKQRNCSFFKCQSPGETQEKNYLYFNHIPGFIAPITINLNEDFISAETPASIENGEGERLWRAPSFIPDMFEEKRGLDIPAYMIFKLKRELEACNEEGVRNLSKGFQFYFDTLKNKELVQYINMLDNQLGSSFFAPSALPSGGCHRDGIYYDSQQTFRKAAKYRENDQRPLSLAEAKELFDLAKAMDMPWEYKQDGCYARAHLMAREFEKLGYDVDKAWAKGDLRVGEGENSVMWNYHVAPALNVMEEDGSIKRYVIDPSIMDGPVPAQEWANLMAEQTGSKINQTAFPFPGNAQNYLRVGLAFSNSDAYWPYPEENLTEDQKLQMAKDTLAKYQGFLDEMD